MTSQSCALRRTPETTEEQEYVASPASITIEGVHRTSGRRYLPLAIGSRYGPDCVNRGFLCGRVVEGHRRSIAREKVRAESCDLSKRTPCSARVTASQRVRAVCTRHPASKSAWMSAGQISTRHRSAAVSILIASGGIGGPVWNSAFVASMERIGGSAMSAGRAKSY